MRRHFSLLLIALAMTPICLAGQLPTDVPQARDEARDAAAEAARERHRHALALADAVAERARTLRPRADALMLLVQYADLVWNEAPDRGRLALQRVVGEVVESESLPPDSLDAISDDRRATILKAAFSVAGRRDAQLLDALIDDLARRTSLPDSPEASAERTAQLYLELARLVVTTDPARAADFIVRSIAAAQAPGQTDLLVLLASVDSARADAALRAALTALLRAQPADVNRVSELSSVLFIPDHSVANVRIGGRDYVNVTGNIGAAPENAELARRYLETLHDASVLASATVPRDVFVVLSNYATLYDRYCPDRREAVLQLLAVCRPSVPDEVVAQLDAYRGAPIPEGTSAESIDRAAANLRRIGDARERDRATLRLLLDRVIGYADRRTSLSIAEGISDPLGRLQVVSLIEFVSIAARCEEDPSYAPDALSIAKLGSPVLRAAAFAVAGESAAQRDDEPLAVSLLESGYREATRIEDPTERVLVILKLATVSAGRGLPQGMELFRAAIAEMNRSETSAPVDFKSQMLRVGLSWQGVDETASLSIRGIGFAPTVDVLAESDYWAATAAIASIRSGVARSWAELRAARRGLRPATSPDAKPVRKPAGGSE